MDSAAELVALERANRSDTPGLSSTAELEAAELAVAQAELRVKKVELQAARGRVATQGSSDAAASHKATRATVDASAREQASMEAEILD